MRFDRSPAQWFRTSLILLPATLIAAAIVFLLLHAAPIRAYKLFLQLAIVFLILVVAAYFRRSRIQAPPALSANNCFVVAALILPAAIYSTTVDFNFVSDDYTLLQMARRPLADALHEYFFVGQVDSSGAAIFYRPVAFSAVNLEYLLWREWIPGYHLASIALHLVCVIALYALCRELRLRHPLPATAALIFGVLPINTQAVTWPTCIFDRLAAAAMLGALAMYLRFRRQRRWSAAVLAIVLFVIALESKEFAYVLPLMLVLVELALRDEHRPGAATRVAASFVIAGAAFLWRAHIIRGVGGYHTASGDYSVFHFDRAFKAVFVRAPGAILFGYNWLQPAGIGFLMVAALTAVLLLAVVARWRPGEYKRISLFCLASVVLSVAPAHFLFWWPDPGLIFSRALYFAAAAFAIFLALVFYRWSSSPRLFYGAIALFVCLSTFALLHNLAAWRYDSHMAGRFLAELKRVEPSPAPATTICIDDLPGHLNGIQFFDVNPSATAQYLYDWRTDVALDRTSDACLSRAHVIHLRWDTQRATLTALQ